VELAVGFGAGPVAINVRDEHVCRVGDSSANGFALPPGPRLLEALGLARPLVLGSRATTAVLKKRVRSRHSITLKSLKDLVRSIGSLEVSFNGSSQ
jgi:hypothetical protein